MFVHSVRTYGKIGDQIGGSVNWPIVISVSSLLVSVAALIGPPLYRRYRLRPKLLIHKSGFVQLHFSSYGPGMVLSGAVQAVNRQQFMTSLEVVVVHEASKEEHTLLWRILFLDPFNVEPGRQVKKDLAAGVMINPQQAYRYDVFFTDPVLEYGPIREIVDRVRREWVALMATMINQVHQESPEALAHMVTQAQETRNQMFLQFMQTETFAWAKEKLEGCFYWKPGLYSMTIKASTAEPNNIFPKSWRFEVSEDCVRSLRFNTEFALGDIAGLSWTVPPWSGCTLDYLEPAEKTPHKLR
jgi:hypothetical protein